MIIYNNEKINNFSHNKVYLINKKNLENNKLFFDNYFNNNINDLNIDRKKFKKYLIDFSLLQENFDKHYNDDFEIIIDNELKKKIDFYNIVLKIFEEKYLKIFNDKIEIEENKLKLYSLIHKKNKNTFIKLGVEAKVNERILEIVKEENISSAEFIRNHVLKYNFENAKKKTKNKKVIIKENKKVISFLSNISNNINQIARYTNKNKTLDKQLIIIINSFKEEIESLRTDLKNENILEEKVINLELDNKLLKERIKELEEK